MTRPKLFYYEPKYIRDMLRGARIKADLIHQNEKELIEILSEIDRHRLYVWFGQKSLRTFCIQSLKFNLTQAQRLTTEVRRMSTTSNIGQPVAVPTAKYADYFRKRGQNS